MSNTYTFTRSANSSNVVMQSSDSTDKWNNFAWPSGTVAVSAGVDGVTIIKQGLPAFTAKVTQLTQFTDQDDAIAELNSAAYLGFSSSGGGGGGNVAPSTVSDSLLVGDGAGSWVESILLLLKNFGSNIYGFVSVLGDYAGLIGRSGNSTALTSIQGSTGNSSSFTATGGLSEIMAQVGGKSGTLKVEGQKPVYAEYPDWQDATMPFFQETNQDLTTGVTNAVIAQNLTGDHDLYITGITAYVISATGTPNWDAMFEVTVTGGIQLGNGTVTEPPVSTNLMVNTAILRFDVPTDQLLFSVTSPETGATSMILRTLVTGFYRPRV